MSLLLAACSQFEFSDLNKEETTYTNVEYSEDGNTITIYLGGGG
jgi:major membrane immunogen (membrane-anchored lipoprotein)